MTDTCLYCGEPELVDARGKARFDGSEGDPRPGVAPGHIPGARNLPYASLYGEDGRFKPPPELRRLFEEEQAADLAEDLAEDDPQTVIYLGIGGDPADILAVSAKTGVGVPEVLELIVARERRLRLAGEHLGGAIAVVERGRGDRVRRLREQHRHPPVDAVQYRGDEDPHARGFETPLRCGDALTARRGSGSPRSSAGRPLEAAPGPTAPPA